MIIVENDPARVEAALRRGRLACPHCDGELGPWGSARHRFLRMKEGAEGHRPRRSRCRSCRRTSVLLPDVALLRRVDAASVIGVALLARAEGLGQRRIAAILSRQRETVRGWLQRFSARAGALATHFSAWAFALDARLADVPPQRTPAAAAIDAIGTAGRAASTLLGPRPVWSWASAMTGGRLLCNTTTPYPAPR